jgi:HEAT repeats
MPKFFASLIAVVAAINYWNFVSTVPVDKGKRLEALAHELSVPDKAEVAAKELLRLGELDLDARRFIAKRLPDIIEKSDPNLSAWRQAVGVAGGLKISEAAPALAKTIDVDTGPDLLTSSSVSNLKNNAAAAALAQIGDPAVPSVIEVLRHGTEKQRVLAVYVLYRIGSPKAKKALEEVLENETDPKWRNFLKKHIAAMPMEKN